MLSAPVRRLVALPLLRFLAAGSGAGAGRGEGHVASPGTAATRMALTVLCGALTGTLLGACGSASGAPPATHRTSSPAGSATPAAAAAPQPCAGLPGGQARWLPMADGGRLEANTAGSGTAAVVFLHEIGRTGMCGFAPYAAWLIQHYPVQVVLVNRCGYGSSDCGRPADTSDIRAETEPAVSWARANGARTVTLVGASGGGGDAIEAAALVPGVSAVVDLSGDVNDTSANNNVLAQRVTVPALLVVAPDDPYCSIAAMQAIYAQIAAPVKRLLIESQLPAVHGWDLLLDGNHQPRPMASVVADWAVQAGS
jgi:pimeloyl-ACP methyl ester carboxylesterase